MLQGRRTRKVRRWFSRFGKEASSAACALVVAPVAGPGAALVSHLVCGSVADIVAKSWEESDEIVLDIETREGLDMLFGPGDENPAS